MMGWLARLRRVDTLDAEVAALRARLNEADAASALGDRLAEIHALTLAGHERAAAAAAALADRVATLESQLALSDETATALAAQAKEIAALHAQILTLERQFRLQINQADDTARVLLDRIEQVRRGEAV